MRHKLESAEAASLAAWLWMQPGLPTTNGVLQAAASIVSTATARCSRLLRQPVWLPQPSTTRLNLICACLQTASNSSTTRARRPSLLRQPDRPPQSSTHPLHFPLGLPAGGEQFEHYKRQVLELLLLGQVAVQLIAGEDTVVMPDESRRPIWGVDTWGLVRAACPNRLPGVSGNLWLGLVAAAQIGMLPASAVQGWSWWVRQPAETAGWGGKQLPVQLLGTVCMPVLLHSHYGCLGGPVMLEAAVCGAAGQTPGTREGSFGLQATKGVEGLSLRTLELLALRVAFGLQL